MTTSTHIARAGTRRAIQGTPHPNFFDVTDSIRRTRNDSTVAKVAAKAIPTEPIHMELVDGYLTQMDTRGIFASISHLSSYFNRYYTTTTGREAVLWLEAEYRKAAGNRPDVQITLFEHDWEQPSLVVTVLGKGDNKAETVVLGGHIDSTAGTATSEAPGADDDASGSSVVLQVFRTLMLNRFEPDRTVEFHAYAAEEVGLRGSQAIAENYEALGREVVSMLQVPTPLFTSSLLFLPLPPLF